MALEEGKRAHSGGIAGGSARLGGAARRARGGARRRPVGYNFTPRVRIGDYEGDLEITDESLNDMRKAVRLLPEAGIEPVRAATAWQTTPKGLPICPKLGAPMKERSKQGDV